MSEKKIVEVYTDGGCRPNPGRGGWGWAEYGKKHQGKQIIFVENGGEMESTNNRMEITAIIEHLKHAPRGNHYIIHSDSEYALKCIIKGGNHGIIETPGSYSGWLKSWIPENFIGKKNIDLWVILVGFMEDHLKNKSILEFKHVKAHSGIPGNELADTLATLGIP